jgi:FHA domain
MAAGGPMVIRRIEKGLKALLPQDASEPLVMKRAICNDLTDEIVAIGEGRKVLPYDQVLVQIFTPSEKQRAIYEVSLVANNELVKTIREHLSQEGCESIDNLDITIELISERPEGWVDENFNLMLSRRAQPKTEGHLVMPSARLTLLAGVAKSNNYKIKKPKFYIGRLADVIDRHGFPVRRNDLIFLDRREDANSTVSRAHAMIEFDEKTRSFILRDTNSRHGTKVERDGQLIELSGPRGMRLQDGDKLFFGKACVSFSVSSGDQ